MCQKNRVGAEEGKDNRTAAFFSLELRIRRKCARVWWRRVEWGVGRWGRRRIAQALTPESTL